MLEIFIAKYEGKVKLFKYILPDGTIVRFNDEQRKIDFEPIIPYIGHEAKVLTLSSEDPNDLGEATVEMKIIKHANKGYVTFEA